MLIGPSARFRSRVTSLLRSQQISRKAAAEKASQSKKLLVALNNLKVHSGTSSWSALSTVAQEHLHLFFVQEVASNHNKELRKLLEIGFTLSNSCVALDSCKSKRVLEESVSQLMDDRKQMLIGPSARFRSRVTDILQRRASVALRASIGKLVTDLNAPLSPSATPPGSPERELRSNRKLPALVLSSGAVVSSAEAGSQIRILKQLFEDGFVPHATCQSSVERLRSLSFLQADRN